MAGTDRERQLERGRDSFARRAWGSAYTELSGADQEDPLEPDDLELLATAAYLIGKDEDSADIWARAHSLSLSQGNPKRAVLCAFWLALSLFNKGDMARGGGWMARAGRVLEQIRGEGVERGYLLVPQALHLMAEGESATAYETFTEATTLGQRFGDSDLIALGRLGQGQALIRLGRVAEGIALLDEDMVAVEAGDLSPILTGIIYCAVITECQATFDLHRAREWTDALSRWCEMQPDLVPYRGQCQVHRAQILQLSGDWEKAADEAERARDQLANADQPAIGMALYQLAELHRLRGEFDQAEEAYREAHGWGHSPQPGLAQMRLAQGQIDAAQAAIRGALVEAHTAVARAKLLLAQVEIMIAVEDIETARNAADELATIAAKFDAPYLRAVSAHAMGSVLLATGNPTAAVESLREGLRSWLALEAPYEAARTRVLIGTALAGSNDQDTASLEFEAARRAFEQLDAKPDLARVHLLVQGGRAPDSHGLTARELEVLRVLASGSTTKAIAAKLVVSERTVDRHISNIFSKLGVSSRAAATAYAYEHELL